MNLWTQHDPSRVLVYYHTALCRHIIILVMVCMVGGFGYSISLWFGSFFPGSLLLGVTLPFVVFSGGFVLKLYQLSSAVLSIREDMKNKGTLSLP